MKKAFKFRQSTFLSSLGPTRGSSGNMALYTAGFPVKRGMTRGCESGRSMIEILGVLALVAILSIVAVAGFQRMVNKNKANTVISESKLAFIEAHARQNMESAKLNLWENVSFTPSYGYGMTVMRDYKSNDYVKVTRVSEGVCAQMLPMQVEGQLAFYTEGYEELTDCEDENTIVVAWNGIGVPAECGVSHDCDVGEYALEVNPHGFPGFCNAEGRCQKCAEDISEVNENRDGCDCDPEVALSCSDEEGNTWCCGGKTICGARPNECPPSDGACSYTFTQQTQTVAANCHWTIIAQEQEVAANCSYTMSDTLLDAEYNTHKLELSPQIPCTEPGQYCYLYYQDSACTTSLRSDTSTTPVLWGVCVDQDSEASRHQCNVISHTTEIMKPVQDCTQEGEYCYLYYAKEDCSGDRLTSNVGATQKEDMWGICIDQDAETATHQIGCNVTSVTPALSEDQGCPAGEYCYLKWKGASCSPALKSEDAGPFHGVCLGQNQGKDEVQCPIS